MHYYPHHIGDFIKDTANLNDHQMVTYLRMIWAYYADEKPFADECDSIAFAMRSDEKTVRLLLRHYFELREDVWHHQRCDRELEAFYSKSEKARESAKKRWANKHQKMQNQPEINANAMRTHNETNANASILDATQYPIPNIKKITNVASGDAPCRGGKADPDNPRGFDRFWIAYGKKVGKQNAIKVWKSIKADDDTIETIISKAALHASVKEVRYRKDPERWLKGRHWEDDLFVDDVHLSSTADPTVGAI
jgi:uncharacterized protein YdaU (DUF1376 family)